MNHRTAAAALFVCLFVLHGACRAQSPGTDGGEGTAVPVIPDTAAGVRITPLPILMYDTDIGVGYGVKVFLKHVPGAGASLDLTAFNSTKGERWYRAFCSWPDAAARQGTAFGWGVDVLLEYDTYLNNLFFGVGPGTPNRNRESFIREPVEASATMRWGISKSYGVGLGVRWRSIRNMRFEEGSRLRALAPASNAGRASYASIVAEAVHDSRDNFLNPSRGTVLRGEVETAYPITASDYPYLRLQVFAHGYRPLAGRWLVAAGRVSAGQLVGPLLPVGVLLPLGGGWWQRGLVRDRFVDRALVAASFELRIALFWRIAAVTGVDAGSVARSLTAMSLAYWTAAPVLGLRFDMSDFLVRFDLGFGREGTGFYMNFGHVF